MRPKLTSFRHTGDFRLSFEYEDGLAAELDFRDHLAARSGPMAESLQDKDFFAKALLDQNVLTWPNGYDVCPDVLRVWAEAGSILSQAETDQRCVDHQEAVQSVG
jgi:hypothetical protein